MINFLKRIKNKNVQPKDYGIEIAAKFITERGRWSNVLNEYVERSSRISHKHILVNICEDNGRLLLKFYGGPTGFESYLLEDMLNNLYRSNEREGFDFCICAGTINRWSACYVRSEDVYLFIKEVMGE